MGVGVGGSGSPLRVELVEDVLGGEVEVNLRRREVIVAEEALEGRERDALLERRHRERVPLMPISA